MSFDYHQLDAQDLLSGNTSDSDYFSELNSAKSNRGGQRSSSLPEPKVSSDGVSDILPLETFMVKKTPQFCGDRQCAEGRSLDIPIFISQVSG